MPDWEISPQECWLGTPDIKSGGPMPEIFPLWVMWESPPNMYIHKIQRGHSLHDILSHHFILLNQFCSLWCFVTTAKKIFRILDHKCVHAFSLSLSGSLSLWCLMIWINKNNQVMTYFNENCDRDVFLLCWSCAGIKYFILLPWLGYSNILISVTAQAALKLWNDLMWHSHRQTDTAFYS